MRYTIKSPGLRWGQFGATTMWKYEIQQQEVQLVLGEEWDLGDVRVCEDAYRYSDGSFDFLEELLLRHLYLEVGELQGSEEVYEAIERAQAKEAGYKTLFNYCGKVYVVKTHAGHKTTDVSVADDDSFSRRRFELNLQDLWREVEDE